jgi:hypothetical protein
MAIFGVALGGVWFAAAAAGDNVGMGVFGFVVITALAAYMAFGRGEFSAISRGDDERQKTIDLEAMQFSYMVLVVVALTGGFFELARGDGLGPFGVICSVGGFSYMLAIAYLKRRR